MIDTTAETVKTKNMKSYVYFEYLLSEISKSIEGQNASFCEDLLSGQTKRPAE